MSTINHITLEELPEPVEIDRFEFRGTIEDITYLHTKVFWKGQHVLSIKKTVDHSKPRPSRSSTPAFDEDDEDERDDEEEALVAKPAEEPGVTWLVQSEWDWIKHNYSPIPTSLIEARAIAIAAVENLAVQVRKAFALRNPKVPL